MSDPCPGGVCGSDPPPLVGAILTGTGLTLRRAAEALERGEPLRELTAVQRRLVEAYAAERALGSARR